MSIALQEIRQLNSRYELARIESVNYEIKSKKLSVNLLFCVHFDLSDHDIIKTHLQKVLPFANIEVSIKKTVCDCELVSRRIVEFVSNRYRAIKDRVLLSDIVATQGENGRVSIVFGCEKEVCDYLETSNFFDALNEFLSTCFCEKFTYSYNPRKDSDSSHLLKEEKVDYSRIEQIPARYFKVDAVTKLFDNNETDTVMYIADAKERSGEIAIAGKIVNRRERVTKNGKTFFILDFNDSTGRMSGTVFSTKEILKKMQKVQEGSEMVAVGKAEVTPEGYHRFTISSLNFCELPKDFVYQERASRKAPESYLVVRPEPIEQVVQTDMFTMADAIPNCLLGKTFVVIDFETTGTMPQEDKITEIGAVKVVDGKIVEKFASMVNPERRIPEQVVELTGITDEMVADAPTFDKVAGDLYKFCDNTIIVAHNIAFDYAFLKNMSKPFNYIYENRGIDTLSLARALLPNLTNHKLNTVCEHFGVEFLHHRAYCDAHATAQIFIELIKMKGSLPEFDI